MRKFVVLIATAICLFSAVSASAGVTDINIRQRSKLYLKAGQVWSTMEVRDIRNTAPRWYWGGGWRFALTEDQRYMANLELKSGLNETFTMLDWSVSYAF